MVLLPVSPVVLGAAEAPKSIQGLAVSALAEALLKEDPGAIHIAVAAYHEALGNQAGEPEVADEFQPVPMGETVLTPQEAKRAFMPYIARLDETRWWKVGVDPALLTSPLRVPASVISGSVAVVRAKLEGADRSLAIAKDAADFLLWAQQQAGSGVFPFPAASGNSKAHTMEAATRFLEKTGKAGQWDRVVRHGWIFDDLGEGSLQFDNGECGLALLDLYEVTRDQHYIESVRKSANWAVAQPLCPNWNYNSFTVRLLAKAWAITRDTNYLNAAIRKAHLGVIPGQLTEGLHVGRWMDPHNARPAYHYIMLGALAQLYMVMPCDNADRAEVRRSLELGLKTRNEEILSQGVMNKDKIVESLLLVNQAFSHDDVFLLDTKSKEALHTILVLLSAEMRRGKAPTSPGSWGHLLEYIVTNPNNS